MLESMLDLHYLFIFVAGATGLATLALGTAFPWPATRHNHTGTHSVHHIPADGATP